MSPMSLPRTALALWMVMLGAGVLAVAASGVPSWAVIAVWGAAFLVGELFWIPTPGRRGSISTAMLVHLAALALLPVGQAVAPAVAVAVLADLGIQRKPMVKAVYNAALLAVTLCAAGLALRAGLNAAAGVPALAWPLAMALAGVTYWVVNRAGVVAIISAAEGVPPGRAWRENFGFAYEALIHAVETVLAGMLVALWARVGPAAIAGLALLCFFLNDAYRRRNRLEELRAQGATEIPRVADPRAA